MCGNDETMRKKKEYHTLISIIVPVYNCAQYLNELWDCFCNQTYINLEFVFIDDGSTDGSIEILRSFERKDKRVRLICNEHCGADASRNVGVRASRGEYIAFVDADDLVKDDYIMQFVLRLKQNADVYIGSMLTTFFGEEPKSKKTCLAEGELSYEEFWKLMIEGKAFLWTLCGKLYRRSVLISDLEDLHIVAGDDLARNWLVCKRKLRYFYIPCFGYIYRMNPYEDKYRADSGALEVLVKIGNEMPLSLKENSEFMRAYGYRILMDIHNKVHSCLIYDFDLYENYIKQLFPEFKRLIKEFVEPSEEYDSLYPLYKVFLGTDEELLSVYRKGLERIKESDSVYIYGAGKKAEWMACEFKRLEISFLAFVVSKGANKTLSPDKTHLVKDVSDVERGTIVMGLNVYNTKEVFESGVLDDFEVIVV